MCSTAPRAQDALEEAEEAAEAVVAVARGLDLGLKVLANVIAALSHVSAHRCPCRNRLFLPLRSEK